MKKVLKYFGIALLLLVAGLTVWTISSEKRQTTAIQVYDRIVTGTDSSTFVFKPNGDIEVFTIDCEDTGLVGWEGTPNTRATVINGVNHKIDNVERVSSQFLRINGKLYDAYVAEFQRIGSDETHNIGNDIKEETFRVTDEEEQYFTDGKNYYFYEYYPAFRACLRMGSPLPPGPNDQPLEIEPIHLSEFQLSTPEEEGFYLGQENNIFIKDKWGEGKDRYTPFAELNDKLYFKSKSGKFVEVPRANPDTLTELDETNSEHFFTDGQFIIFQGEVLDFDLTTFKQIKGGHMNTHFFEIEGDIYHLHIPINAHYHDATLTKTDIDPDTFETLDTTGSFSGIVYQDKDFIYDLKNRYTEWSDVTKTPR